MQPTTTKTAKPTPNLPDLLTPEQAAQFLGLSPRTLSVWRCTGRWNLPFVKIGRTVRYNRDTLIAWAEKHSRSFQTGEA